jgi:non-specific serine/threonine protein kinase/serine/threonine-protein kinase
MTPVEWQRVKAVLHGALELRPAQRGEFLDRNCAGDGELRREVEDLLSFENAEDITDGLNVTSWQAERETETAAPPSDPGRVGAYVILRRLGEGGMGVVYLAARDDGAYQHEVAVKVLKGGSQAVALARRFRRERQVLAGLDHPNIARLIDGGATETGQPYYAMEYVAGVPVTEFARAHGLGLRDRLNLFRGICDAVASAHRQLVIHGDIKPANILVGADGAPKLLDFGLARILQTASTASTETPTLLLMTPGYASPEQVRGERLSTATDIYSLGVVLYELLTGEGPYGGDRQSPLELCRAICDVEPKRPSTVLRRRGAESDMPLTPRQLRGELDHVVLKALRKAPGERYASVDELRADLDRYLGGFPVRAARGSALYRLRKFVARHRWGVATGVLAAALGCVAVWTVWRAERVAQMRFNQVRQLAHAVVFDLHDAIAELPGSTAARELLVERALEYLKNLEATSARNRDLQLELAQAYTKIGLVQAGKGEASLGDFTGAVASYEHARAILHAVLQRSPGDEPAAEALVEADNQEAGVREQRGESREWRQLRAEVGARLNDLSARHPDDRVLRLRALSAAAYTLDGDHDWPRARAAYERVLAPALEYHAAEPANDGIARMLARTHSALAEVLHALNDVPGALKHHREALRINLERLARAPGATQAKLDVSWNYSETGWLEHERHQEVAAVADFDRALALLRSIVSADARNQLASVEVAKLEMAAAPALELSGDRKRAIATLRDAIGILSAALERDASDDDARMHLAEAWGELGDLYGRIRPVNCGLLSDAYHRAIAATAPLKADYPAGAMFDMGELRTRVAAQLNNCTGGPGNRSRQATRSSASR